jgi:hypothetical protein
MSGSADSRKDDARRKAQKLFASTERRKELARKEQENERDAVANKTAKLRAMRLAKEQEDAEAPKPTPAPKRAKT